MTLDFLCLVRYNSRALGTLAQLVEHIVHIDGVTGSSPVSPTIYKKRKPYTACVFYINWKRDILQRKGKTLRFWRRVCKGEDLLAIAWLLATLLI